MVYFVDSKQPRNPRKFEPLKINYLYGIRSVCASNLQQFRYNRSAVTRSIGDYMFCQSVSGHVAIPSELDAYMAAAFFYKVLICT